MLTKPPVLPIWAERGDKTQPTLVEIAAGWPLSNIPPSRQRFNWILHFLAQGVRYLCRRGIPDHDAQETYQGGDCVLGPDGKTYQCLRDGVRGSPPGEDSRDCGRWGFTQRDLQAVMPVGTVISIPRTKPPKGFMKANGATLWRDVYPELWQEAQDSGLLVTEEEWLDKRFGAYSAGDGKTTFRVPDMRGEFIRGFDDGRGIDSNRELGRLQEDALKEHSHGASSQDAGEHKHAAWTDMSGTHKHAGGTTASGEHRHNFIYNLVTISTGNDYNVISPGEKYHTRPTSFAGIHSHTVFINPQGEHRHNVGMNLSGVHVHNIDVLSTGGSETRSRNIALLYCIKY